MAVPESLRLDMRGRPGMYIGGLNPRGLLRILDDVVTELLALPDTRPERVWCGLGADGTCTVELSGGPVGAVEAEDFETDAGDNPADERLFSLKIASAFGDPLTAEVVRDGRRWVRTFVAGLPAGPLEVISTTAPANLRIRYQPDPALFSSGMGGGYLTVCGRAREWAVFHPHVRFTVGHEGDGQRRDYHYPAGLLSLAQELEHQWWQWQWMNSVSNVWHCTMKQGTESAEVVFVHRPCGPGVVHAFVNGYRILGGGSHVEGLRGGVAAVAERFTGEDGISNPLAFGEGRDPLEGLTVLLAVRLDEPRWRYSTKDVLDHDGARELVRRTIIEMLPGENPANGREPDGRTLAGFWLRRRENQRGRLGHGRRHRLAFFPSPVRPISVMR